MATVERTPIIPARVARSDTKSSRRRIGTKAITYEVWLVFLVAFAGYMLLGWQVVHNQHLIIFDATARLAHAYFVFWNDPGKLASIGFVWAPFSTLVFLPFALIKPLATSLAALTATSAFFAALMMAVLVRGCALLGMPRWQRLPLVLLFAVNPMILYYAVNGMSETPFLALLTISVYFFIRWFVEGKPQWLVPCGLAMATAVLTRYEVLGFALIMAVAIPFLAAGKHRSQDELEGSTLAFLAPLVNGMGLWIFFNWLILGEPLFWLQQQIGIGGNGGETTAGAPTPATVASTGPSGPAPPTRTEVLRQLIEVNAQMFPLVLIVIPALLAAFAWSRRAGATLAARTNGLMSFWLALLVAANLITTAILVLKSPQTNLLQLRYNMRALPVAILALAWLWYVASGNKRRLIVWLAGMAILAGTIPLTWHAMQTWKYQYEENVFVQALKTGKDQEGTNAGGPYTIGNVDDRDMAAWITKHVPKTKDAILTDDGQTFGVMLAQGHPDLFFDRIDKGDGKWKQVVDRPWGKVAYILVARYPLPPAGTVDEIQIRKPGLRLDNIPGVSVEYANDHYVLLRVASRRPRAAQTRFDRAFSDLADTSVPRL